MTFESIIAGFNAVVQLHKIHPQSHCDLSDRCSLALTDWPRGQWILKDLSFRLIDSSFFFNPKASANSPSFPTQIVIRISLSQTNTTFDSLHLIPTSAKEESSTPSSINMKLIALGVFSLALISASAAPILGPNSAELLDNTAIKDKRQCYVEDGYEYCIEPHGYNPDSDGIVTRKTKRQCYEMEGGGQYCVDTHGLDPPNSDGTVVGK